MRNTALTTLILLGLTVAAIPAQAADSRWYVAPTVSYVHADDDRREDNGAGVGLAFGKALNEQWNMELGGRYLRIDSHDKLASFGFDGLRFLNRNPSFAPYAVVGVGYARDTHDNNLMFNAGIGFLKQISENIDLRADARYHWHTNEKDAFDGSPLGDWLVSVGVNVPFGR